MPDLGKDVISINIVSATSLSLTKRLSEANPNRIYEHIAPYSRDESLKAGIGRKEALY